MLAIAMTLQLGYVLHTVDSSRAIGIIEMALRVL
jgi:hypothetical protein